MTHSNQDSEDVHRTLLEIEARWIRRREDFYAEVLPTAEPPTVYHWSDGLDPHIDVYAFGPGPGRPNGLLLTGGMADRPMPGLRRDDARPRRVELLFEMPYAEAWAADVLREISLLPFLHGVVLSEGGLICGNRPITKGSTLRHAVLGPAGIPGIDGFLVEGEPVTFLRVHFVTEREYRFGATFGGVELLSVLEAERVENVLKWRRRSVV